MKKMRIHRGLLWKWGTVLTLGLWCLPFPTPAWAQETVQATRLPVRPLPVIPPDSLVQTYTGRLAYTLLNGYVTCDSLRAMLSGYVKTSDVRLSDSRTPKGVAGGDLKGDYPNPTIKSDVYLPGSPSTDGPLVITNENNKDKVPMLVFRDHGGNEAGIDFWNGQILEIGSSGDIAFWVDRGKEIRYDESFPSLEEGSDRCLASMGAIRDANFAKANDPRFTDSRTPKGAAGGDLTGSYPSPTIKSSVTLTGNPTVSGNLTTNGTFTVNGTGESRIWGNLRLKGSGNYGNKINLGDGDYVYLYEATDDNLTVKAKNIYLSPTSTVTAPTPASSDNSTKVATTAYVKSNLSGYVTTSDARLSDSRTPQGTAGGDLTGSYPNPTIKSSVNLPGSPTTTTQATYDNSTKVATTAYVKNNLANYAGSGHTHTPNSLGAPRLIGASNVSSNGTETQLYGSLGVSRTGTGTYRIYTGTQHCVPLILPLGARLVQIYKVGNYTQIQTTDLNGTATDASFFCILLGL